MTWVRSHAGVVLGVYSLFLLLVLFSPVSSAQSGAVLWLSNGLSDVWVPDVLAQYSRVEVVMNAVIIAPIPFLGSFLRPSWRWQDWTAYAFVAALAVELVQGVLLPDRQASFSDVVANASGALLGSLPHCLMKPRSSGGGAGLSRDS